ncbi:MAG: hypothetical protein A2235_12900 [Deltaproteobacteria bacterium RIFOXYA2_FULL_42_10]|nr:MAG: hypothetical protein A2090_00765 [Deltaproteobacteria bacterium GWD2_42_10]OGQ67161.1 MAG: hypothetical protein A3F88_02680 [Deltaproteobacteria bacterium RIFCSPLOWO2_12_FULL_42_16]OGQ72475.1 MAG: hypothetical protein A2235_12900 [Deltaproteobacteria bacterium RIFOXYA2_FULL_42_10]
MILFIPIFLMLVIALFVLSFPQTVAFTKAVVDWCQSLFFQCIEFLLILKVFLLWFALIVIAGWFTYALVKAIYVLIKAHVKIKRLPIVNYGDVAIIKDDKLKTAFTHGFINPRIYLSTGLINYLDNSELKAVYLHELHHRNRRDPLRLFLVSILKDAFFYIPVCRFAERFIYNRIEVGADRAAVAAMQEPLSLAGALLKVTEFNIGQASVQPASVHLGIEGVGPIEQRIRRLIEGKEISIKLPTVKAMIVSIFITSFLLLSTLLPVFSSFPDPGRCDTNHCAVHINKLGMDCKIHCEASKGHSH